MALTLTQTGPDTFTTRYAGFRVELHLPHVCPQCETRYGALYPTAGINLCLGYALDDEERLVAARDEYEAREAAAA